MTTRTTNLIVIVAMALMSLIAGNEIIHRMLDDGPQTSPAVVTEPTPRTVVITPVPSTPTTTTTTTIAATTTTAHDALQADLDLLALDPSVPCQEWAPLALNVGWPTEELENLLEEIWQESRCQSWIINKSSPDHGLLQLNEVWRDEFETYFGPWENVLDPRLNLAMGLEIWRWHDANRGCGWEPWSRPC